MKKDIVKQLRAVADTTPAVFEWRMLPELFTGAELNLTPLADAQPEPYIPDAVYVVDMPALVAVDHYQQYKDAYKRDGWEGVKAYHRSVMDKIKNCKTKAAA